MSFLSRVKKRKFGWVKKKILPLKVLYRDYADKLKNPQFIQANKRLKKFRSTMESKEKLVSTLFYDPFKPLNLNSKMLTELDDEVNHEDTHILKRQNQVSLHNRRKLLSSSNSLQMPKFYFQTKASSSSIVWFNIYLDFQLKIHADPEDNQSLVSENSEDDEIINKLSRNKVHTFLTPQKWLKHNSLAVNLTL